MIIRTTTAVAFTAIITSPAFADCNQELKLLEQKVVSAETGASTSETGMAATKHQEELVKGKQKSGAAETTGTTARAVEPASPHQEQVTGRVSAQGWRACHPNDRRSPQDVRGRRRTGVHEEGSRTERHAGS
ncbi:hypothetical protein ACFIOY_13635 [Bradyrhizobium sp. TZ2]